MKLLTYYSGIRTVRELNEVYKLPKLYEEIQSNLFRLGMKGRLVNKLEHKFYRYKSNIK